VPFAARTALRDLHLAFEHHRKAVPRPPDAAQRLAERIARDCDEVAYARDLGRCEPRKDLVASGLNGARRSLPHGRGLARSRR
jgi:hypothetical protein